MPLCTGGHLALSVPVPPSLTCASIPVSTTASPEPVLLLSTFVYLVTTTSFLLLGSSSGMPLLVGRLGDSALGFAMHVPLAVAVEAFKLSGQYRSPPRITYCRKRWTGFQPFAER
jgi:hypothetical protein